MGIKVLQVNIQHWDNNHYFLKYSLSNNNPDVILLNELSLKPNSIPKITGYKCIYKCPERFTGVAIFVKCIHKHFFIEFDNDHILATRLFTNLGPINIVTCYTTPRFNHHPTKEINKILDSNLPTVLIGDFNAKHAFFDNCSQGNADIRGNQLYSLCMARNLHYLGPNFNTYKCNDREGKPDIILANNQFQIFQHLISKGEAVGSDHAPMIIHISIFPIKVLCRPRPVIRKLGEKLFQSLLKDDTFEDLDGKQVSSIDETMEKMTKNITNATTLSCPTTRNKVISSYEFTNERRDKFALLQTAYSAYFLNNSVPLHLINILKADLLLDIKNHQSERWKQITDLTAEHFGDPQGFWRDFNTLRGGKKKSSSSLKVPPDTDGFVERSIISEPSEKAKLMGICWEKIFQSNKGPGFINANTKMVNAWYRSIKESLQHDEVIDFSKLSDSHPIFRCITVVEFRSAINHTADKTPGKDGIRIKQIKSLPPNYIKAIINVHNSSLASKYFPELSKITSMIFIHKPFKDLKDPYGYRPISLLNILGKLLEKIIAQRYLYFLEHHNILADLQFGFRKGRSTQHPIFLLHNAIIQLYQGQIPHNHCN